MKPLCIVAALALGLVLPQEHARADVPVLDLEDYRGRVVIVDFWASWCVPCRRSFPWLNSMQHRYGDDGLVIIGINLDTDPTEARAFLDQYPADFMIVRDADGVLARQFEVAAMPTSYVVDRDGQIVGRHLGFKVKKTGEYEAVIRSALLGITE